MFDQLTLWFLRRFKLFRAQERRLEQLTTHEGYVERMPKGSQQRVEVEVLHALLIHASAFLDCDVLPTKRVDWLGPGQIRVQLFEGGGEGG